MERAKKPSAIPVSPVTPAPQVSISDDNSRVTASLPTGERVEVLLHGATVISWKSSSGKENIFLSSKAHLDGSKSVRGGIPLVFPIFGKPDPNIPEISQLVQHGFARSSRWEYLGKSSSESSKLPNNAGDSSVKLDFGLEDSMITDLKWKGKFSLIYSVTLSTEDLETSIVVRNTGTENFSFKFLFHSYFRVNEITNVTVAGLEKAPFQDQLQGNKKVDPTSKAITIDSEIDRIYTTTTSSSGQQQPVSVLENDKTIYQVQRENLRDVVVWNPWEAKAKTMADLGPEDAYYRFICIEAGHVTDWIQLEGGEYWEGGQRIKIS